MLIYLFLLLIVLPIAIILYLNNKKEVLSIINSENEMIPADVISSFNFFKDKVEALSKSIDMLEELVGEYFMTLNSSGHIELVQIRGLLESAVLFCEELLKDKKINELKECLSFLVTNSGCGEAPDIIANSMSDLDLLHNWPQNTQILLTSLEKSLSDTSKKYKMIGRTKKRERQATDIVLGELRRTMIKIAKDRGSKK